MRDTDTNTGNDQHRGLIHPLKRRLLAEEFVRLRRADEKRRYAASQRRARVDPNPHQIDAVVFALKRIPEGGCILADEVGLGKTIEAGLVIAQLLAEDTRRVLLIVPKSLVGQWQAELYDLFSIEAREGRDDPESFAGEGVFLVHREFAGGLKGSSHLKAADAFDLVVIDEAHEIFANIYRRFDKEGTYRNDADEAQIADRVRSFLRPAGTPTPVLLLTATPIQNSLAEIWGLVQYVEPTGMLLGKLPTFRKLFCEDAKDRTLIPGQEFELRRRLNSVLQRTLRRQAQEFLEVPFVERQAKLIDYSMTVEEKELYNQVTAWLMDPYICSFSGKNRRLLLIGFHRRMASSLAALASSLQKVIDRLKRTLAGCGDSDGNELARDFAADLEEDIEDLYEPKTEEPKSPPTPERIRAELARVEGFLGQAKAIPLESKAVGLLEALQVIRDRSEKGEGSGKVVIFTESLQTQDFLCDLLTNNGYHPEEVTLFRGLNNTVRAGEALERWEEEVGRAIPVGTQPSQEVAIRLALVHEFKTRSKVFISTEAGAKGLNLQFCENLINYDLPWNPQRIEQRIGRVHRYGQRRGVTILNLLDRGNESQRLTFDILSLKLDLFGKVLDASDAILYTPSEREKSPEPFISMLGDDFETQLRRIYEQAHTVDEIAEGLRRLRDTIDAKRREFDDEQARATDLIKTRFDDSVRQVFLGYKEALPATLKELDRDMDALIRGFLQATGAIFERIDSSGRILYRLSASANLPNECRNGGTFLIGQVRELADGEPIHCGHPLVRAAIDEAREATSRPLAVDLVHDEGGQPECLIPLVGRRGRLVVTKVTYRGFERVEHLLYTALLESENTPLDHSVVRVLLGLSPHDVVWPEGPPTVDRSALDEAIEIAVLEDQTATTVEDQKRFERKLEQLDRFLEDQIRVLSAQRSRLERKKKEAEARQASAPSLQARRGSELRIVEQDIQKLGDRINNLKEGDDPDYQQWRDRLYARRFQRPEVHRVLEVDFRVTTWGGAC